MLFFSSWWRKGYLKVPCVCLSLPAPADRQWMCSGLCMGASIWAMHWKSCVLYTNHPNHCSLPWLFAPGAQLSVRLGSPRQGPAHTKSYMEQWAAAQPCVPAQQEWPHSAQSQLRHQSSWDKGYLLSALQQSSGGTFWHVDAVKNSLGNHSASVNEQQPRGSILPANPLMNLPANPVNILLRTIKGKARGRDVVTLLSEWFELYSVNRHGSVVNFLFIFFSFLTYSSALC